MERIREWKDRMSKKKFYLPAIAVTVIVLLIVTITLIVTMKGREKDIDAPNDRIECPSFSEDNCTDNMCSWQKVKKGPSCYMEKDQFGYNVSSIKAEQNSIIIELVNRAAKTPFGDSWPKVTFNLTYVSENILRFQFKEPGKQRYEVPVQEDFPLLQTPRTVDTTKLVYEVTHSNQSDIFHFQIRRKENGETLWDSRIGALLLSDQYLQIASYLASEFVYGLGEHVHDTLKHDMNFKTWPMFSADRPPKTNAGPQNLYGVHPFFTCLENSGKSYGVLILNSNAMEVTMLPAPAISYRTIGGILDFFMFVGINPEHVIRLYTSLIGRPRIPPYWGLGFQLSRYGYGSLAVVQDLVNKTLAANIPLACQVLDIDHMNKNKIFTYDDQKFAGLPQYIEKTKTDHNLKWIIILDPAVAAEDGYAAYASGIDANIYMKRSSKWQSSMFPTRLQKVNVTFGKVWPESPVAFPDYFLDEGKQWWIDNIVKHYETIKFDGLWIDMNEPSNFDTNEERASTCKGNEVDEEKCWTLKCPESNYEDPPYNPLLKFNVARLSKKTLCMESIHGSENNTYLHYDVHSLYGWSQTRATLQAGQQATGTRSLVISRSTYPSSGRYTGHWLGDNLSSFVDLKRSIIGMLEFNLFGIPYVGADVCGFFGDTTPDLCKRWMQLGAFYPFFRNHNGLDQQAQDPVSLGEVVTTASRKAIERRISLNPYLYTLFYRAYVDGDTVVRPVFHEFPNDTIAKEISTQFLWGKYLMITPILDQDLKSLTMYLPKDEWWHFKLEKSWRVLFTEKYIIEGNADEYTPVIVRGGVILPYAIYTPGTHPQNVTDNKFTLYVFPKQNRASGELFVDDGISIQTYENEAYAMFNFTYADCSLKLAHQVFANFTGKVPELESVVVFKTQKVATVGGYNFTMDEDLKVTVINVNNNMKDTTEITWADDANACNMLP